MNPDLIVSALEDMDSELTETFLLAHPLMAYIIKGKEIEKVNAESYVKSFPIVTNGPGQLIGVPTGNESVSATRRDIGRKGNEQPYRFLYVYMIPCKDLARANGEKDIAKLLRQYPVLGMEEMFDWTSVQMARGAGSSGFVPAAAGANGIVTLNGDQTYSPDGVNSRTGVFQYSTNQTATVFGVPMRNAATNPCAGWYHQYAHINGFAADGMYAFGKMITDINQQGRKSEGGRCNLILADQGTYLRYLRMIEDKYVLIDSTQHPMAQHFSRDGITIRGGIDMYWEPDLDPTDTTSYTSANPRLGIALVLSTADWEMFFAGNAKTEATGGNFEHYDPILLQDGDAYQYRMAADFNFYCKQLRTQGCLTGGAQE